MSVDPYMMEVSCKYSDWESSMNTLMFLKRLLEMNQNYIYVYILELAREDIICGKILFMQSIKDMIVDWY